jgi:hypothetical protein
MFGGGSPRLGVGSVRSVRDVTRRRRDATAAMETGEIPVANEELR